MKLFAIFLLALLSIQLIHAEDSEGNGGDWWDRFVDTVSSSVHDGADYIKEKAGPYIREKFDTVKAKLQDPETHEQVQLWVREKAVPVIQEKWEQVKTFVNEEVAPEAKKVYEAAVSANEKLEKEKAEAN
ncbi:unnamed protein product [Bursaphelenchus xylophilus]|uniref:(pine wood nematode) hypothetical protein n=1 Tax=Bursaphelenchus xylophilus TaxID=6326 RepID=A0A1I7SXA1_BURXY|nr:unnamed protein product [Bursaphelenchus xylophilus]CAG9100280.1 unnamed protein product [Bursaphelenchus xylophilus]